MYEVGQVLGKYTVLYQLPGEDNWILQCECGCILDPVAQKCMDTSEIPPCPACTPMKEPEFEETFHLPASTKKPKKGKLGTSSYSSWRGMIRRCTDPTQINYHNYGARGIKVCEQWQGEDGYKQFVKDMGHRPSKNVTLDRIDCNGDYTPENCQWATKQEQAVNRRDNRKVRYNGVIKTLKEWAQEAVVPESTFYVRIARKWDIERALTTPARKRRDYHPSIVDS
jgi:hypothetical protein